MEGARPATEADLPRIEELQQVAITELGPMRGGRVFVHREARHGPPTLGGDDTVLLAGTIDEVVMGYATGRVEELRDGTVLGTIDDLFVEEGGRGVGVGEALMDALLPWFRAKGCSGVDATALPGNRATKNFFEGAGFSARLIVMHHKMEPET